MRFTHPGVILWSAAGVLTCVVALTYVTPGRQRTPLAADQAAVESLPECLRIPGYEQYISWGNAATERDVRNSGPLQISYDIPPAATAEDLPERIEAYLASLGWSRLTRDPAVDDMRRLHQVLQSDGYSVQSWWMSKDELVIHCVFSRPSDRSSARPLAVSLVRLSRKDALRLFGDLGTSSAITLEP
jgi:hypothetical protein